MSNWNSFLDKLKVNVALTPDNIGKHALQQLGKEQNTFVKEDAGNVSTVYTCIEIKSDTMARLPLNIKEESSDGDKILKEDPLHYLLHYQPNSYTNAFNFWWAIEYYRNLKGNSYVRIIRNNRGKPESLKLIFPQDVVGYSLYNNQIYYTYYERKLNGSLKDNPTKVNGTEILHFTFGSNDGINGIDPISKLMLELNIKVKAGKTVDQLYANNALNKVLILPHVNNEAIKNQINQFNKNTSINSTGKLRQLPAGSNLLDMSLDMNSIQFIESMKFTVSQIGSLYRIPAHMLGILEQTKFSSVEAMTLDFKSSSISPIAKMYKRELESKLLTKDEILKGKIIEFNTNALIETDLDTKNKIMTDQVLKGLISPNYAASVYGYPQYEGGDYHYMPSSSMFAEIRAKSDLEKLDQLTNPKDFTIKNTKKDKV